MAKISPTQRTLKWCRQHGHVAQVVEHWNGWAKVRQDLFGIIDVLSLDPTHTAIIGIQTTSGTTSSARLLKASEAMVAAGAANQIYAIVAQAAGAEPRLVHVPSDLIAAFDPEQGASLLGDKAHSMIFDNSKIRRLVPDFRAQIPFWQGAQEIIAWYDADPARQVVDPVFDTIQERIIAAVESIYPAASLLRSSS